MPNQYSNNFELNIQKKYGKSANELLHDFHDQGLSYNEASQITGYQIWTVKRWCRRYNVSLAQKASQVKSYNQDFLDKFHEAVINKYNVLSKRWVSSLH